MSAPGVRQAQRADVVAAICAGRDAVVVGAAEGEGAAALPTATVMSLDAFLRGGARDAGAVVVLDRVPGRLLARAALALEECVQQGCAVVLAVKRVEEPLVLARLPGARVLRQAAMEVVALGGDPLSAVDVPAPPPESAICVLLVAGADLPDDLPEPDVRLGRAAIGDPLMNALLEEVRELRSANVRLRASQRPVESAAAAAIIGERTGRELLETELHARVAELEQIAKVNDELFQEARSYLTLRDEEIAGLRRTLAKPQHRAAASAAHRASRVPGFADLARKAWRSRP